MPMLRCDDGMCGWCDVCIRRRIHAAPSEKPQVVLVASVPPGVRRARHVFFAFLYGIVLGGSIDMAIRLGMDYEIGCGIVLPILLAGWHFNDAVKDS